MYNNPDFERAILASLIWDPILIVKHQDELKNGSNLFFYESHKVIFNVIMSLSLSNAPVEESFIMLTLSKNGYNLEKDMLTIMTTSPAASIIFYIKELKEMSKKRELIRIIHSLDNDIQEGRIETDALLSKSIEILEGFRGNDTHQLMKLIDITTIEDEDADFICKDWLPFPKKTVSLIIGPGGAGKSWLISQLVMRFLNETNATKAFAWLSEDPASLTSHRSKKIAEMILDKPFSSFQGRYIISNSSPLQILIENGGKGVEINVFFNTLKKILDPYDLIVFDPLIAFFGADENSNFYARKFMQLFADWAADKNKTIIFIHHSTKNTTQSRGASAFVDAVRAVYEITPAVEKKEESNDPLSHLRKITLTKDNYNAARLLDGKTVTRQIFPQKVMNLSDQSIFLTPISHGR